MNRTINYSVSEAEADLSVEQFLRRRGYSRRDLTELRKPEHPTYVNGRECILKRRLSAGDRLQVCIRETAVSKTIAPVDIPLSVVYEDEDLIVIDKPSGLPCHPSRTNRLYSAANGLAWYYQQKGQPFVFRCINRLDRGTSGLTVIAKHFLSASILAAEQKDGRMKREYLAVVCGTPDPPSGTVSAPLSRVPGRSISRVVDFENGAKAVTHYRLLEQKNGYSLLSCVLETGRTHQIRAHMRYLGCPIAGDPIYNPACAKYCTQPDEGDWKIPIEINGITRQALHACRLKLVQPVTGEALTFSAPIPEDMQAFGFSYQLSSL